MWLLIDFLEEGKFLSDLLEDFEEFFGPAYGGDGPTDGVTGSRDGEGSHLQHSYYNS